MLCVQFAVEAEASFIEASMGASILHHTTMDSKRSGNALQLLYAYPNTCHRIHSEPPSLDDAMACCDHHSSCSNLANPLHASVHHHHDPNAS
jgi:hypothetical protein